MCVSVCSLCSCVFIVFMCVHVCLCVFMCVYVCLYVPICAPVCLCVVIYSYVCSCVIMCDCVWLYVLMCVYVWLHVFTCTLTRVFMSARVCLHMYSHALHVCSRLFTCIHMRVTTATPGEVLQQGCHNVGASPNINFAMSTLRTQAYLSKTFDNVPRAVCACTCACVYVYLCIL